MNFTARENNSVIIVKAIMVCLLILGVLCMPFTRCEASAAPPSSIDEAGISGCAFIDENANLLRDADEVLITGVNVTLERLSDDNWEEIETMATDKYGKYAFDALEAGEYRVLSGTNSAEFFVAAVGQATNKADDEQQMCSQSIKLSIGDQLTDVADIALAKPASLTFTAFLDNDADGIQAKRDRAVGEVMVEVMSGDVVIGSAVTDMSGVAHIEQVQAGKHTLRVTLPSGYAFTAVGESPETGDSCAFAEGDVATSKTFTFEEGKEVAASIGTKTVGSFGGIVFEDMNNDGIYDEGEPGVAGVTLYLTGKRTGANLQTLSDDLGNYSFSNLQDDMYTITADLPDSMLYARYSRTGGDLRSIFSGSTTQREYSLKKSANITDMYIGMIENGVIQGIAFLDVNYNGIYDEDEPAYEKIKIEVTKGNVSEVTGKAVTGEDGSFKVEALRSGDYRLRALLPDDKSIFTIVPQDTTGQYNQFEQKSNRRDQVIGPLTIVSGESCDVVIGVALGATVSGTVFEDKDYNGSLGGNEKKISGVEVQLIDQAGGIVTSATTNAKGVYTLDGIMPGEYSIQVKRKKDYGFTRLRPLEKGGSYVTMLVGEYGVTDTIEIAMAQEIKDINAGMLPSSTLTGIFFDDLNDNGLQDEGEGGYVNASVRLLSSDSEIDLTAKINEDGSYFFDGVMPGEYTLTYLLPQHAVMANVVDGGNTLEGEGLESTTKPFTVKMGEAYQCYLVGAVTLGSFDGLAFRDVNANGMLDDGEKTMTGVTVTLTPDSDSAEELTAVSGTDGSYSIVGLRPAGYKLSVELPDGYIISHSIDTENIVLAAQQSVTTDCSWQALISRKEKQIGIVKPSTISGVVWLDENKDGVRASEESLLSKLTVELIDETTGVVVKRTASDEQGFTFTNVRSGKYTARFLLPSQSEPASDASSTFAQNASYMEQKGIEVAEDQAVSSLMTGIVSRTSIGGKLWFEENNVKSAVAGAWVKLFAGNSTSPLQTVETGEDGSYRFDGLWPDEYYLQAELPSSMVFVRPDDPNYQAGTSVITEVTGDAGMSEAFSLKMADHLLGQNIVYIKPAKIGDQAWLDENANGLVDGIEPKLAGITISLLQNDEIMYQMVTNEFGYYLFDDVYPGSYVLKAEAYPELGITMIIPELRMISSCLTSGDGTEARSDEFSVESGSKNVNFDLGYVLLEGKQLTLDQQTTRDWTQRNAEGPL
ncbi:MAG: hypothetical protein GX096_12680 [Clostridiales bacterium]|nr:hypothetical protein [Clostridiales bacterium]